MSVKLHTNACMQHIVIALPCCATTEEAIIIHVREDMGDCSYKDWRVGGTSSSVYTLT